MNVDEYNAQIAAGMTEKRFQQLVVGLASTMGYLCYHTWDSRRSQPGFPDLCMVKGERVVFAELKTMKGRLSPEQVVWRDALHDSVAEWYCFRPADYLSGLVESTLR